MADPTQPEPQKIDLTRPGSKIFDQDPSLNDVHFFAKYFFIQSKMTIIHQLEIY